MSKLRFGAPLYLYFDQSRPDLGMAPVVDVDEGLHVIQRGPIARYRFASRSGGEREAWSTALYALTRAKFHPRGDKTEEARSALRRLAFAAGALVTITRGRTFSPERGGGRPRTRLRGRESFAGAAGRRNTAETDSGYCGSTPGRGTR